jgi:nitrogen fixation protein NifU and related proteins
MSDLRDLYQEVILDHNKRPRNFRAMADASARAEGHNPLCGDRVTVYVRLEGGRIADISFEGSGCAISKASASLMTDSVKGQTIADSDRLFQAFQSLMTAGPASSPEVDDIGKLEVLAGVRDYPSRIKCATLAWHALQAAVHGGSGGAVKSE